MPYEKETKGRSIAKAVSYRIICIVVLAIVTYAIIGDLLEMTYIVVVFQSIQAGVYYVHERAWEKVGWGYI